MVLGCRLATVWCEFLFRARPPFAPLLHHTFSPHAWRRWSDGGGGTAPAAVHTDLGVTGWRMQSGRWRCEGRSSATGNDRLGVRSTWGEGTGGYLLYSPLVTWQTKPQEEAWGSELHARKAGDEGGGAAEARTFEQLSCLSLYWANAFWSWFVYLVLFQVQK
jgi:hypothetical protein